MGLIHTGEIDFPYFSYFTYFLLTSRRVATTKCNTRPSIFIKIVHLLNQWSLSQLPAIQSLSLVHFFLGNSKNDASILKHIMINNFDDILNWIEENDIMILDRGFRDSLGVLKSFGIAVAIPCFLSHNEKQFDVQEANNSRFVTMLRRVVESVNARIKRFKWFGQVIPNSLLPFIENFTAILAALLNCFHTPMVTTSTANDIITHMNSLRTKSNAFQTYLMGNQLTQSTIRMLSTCNI